MSRMIWVFTVLMFSGVIVLSSPGKSRIPPGMVLVEGGTFFMGSAKRVTDEEPPHTVTIKGFYIGKYEVTQAEWKSVMGNNPSLDRNDNLPVETVTWYEAVEYCNGRSRKEGLSPCYTRKGDDVACDFSADGYRLPTEAEWEYACRGGPVSANYRYSGSNNPLEVAWYEDNSGAVIHPVGRLKPNELGIYDMSGNAWEWCWDWYDEDYYKTGPIENPCGPSSGKVRVYRGGGAGGYFYWMRCTGRYFYQPRQKHWFVGLRVVRNGPVAAGAEPPEGMIFVKGGSFRMGGSEGIRGERLVHRVTLDSFYMGKYEVTQEEWMAVMGKNPGEFRFIKNPMNFVHWHGAVEYCNKRSRMEGLTPCYSGSGDRVVCDFSADGYRLPTEAEWEYAARGGLKSRDYRYSGSDDADETGWYGENSGNRPHPVGQKKPNELGIYDMSGNVWEWCWDWYDFDYHNHDNNPAVNPVGSSTGIGRVFRGGSWKHLKAYLNTTFRNQFEPFREYSSIGFRVVRTVNVSNKTTARRAIKSFSGGPGGRFFKKAPLAAGGNNKMIFVKGGTFTMGSREIFSDEEPVHHVFLDSFYLGRYEVTQAEWRAVMGYNPSQVKGDGLPVESIDWYEAVEFCNKKSRAHGLTPCYSGGGEEIVCDFDADGYRLPTEAEWEYAAGGGGDPGKTAWYEMNSGFKTRPVGQKGPNEPGIYDMSGNVGEWCWDRYDKEYYKTAPAKNPKGPSIGGSRSYRGGSFNSPVMELRPAVRFNRPPGYKNFDLGFRLAKKNTGVNRSPEGMVAVRGGTFKMGSGAGRNGGKIVHRVTVDSFYIGRFEITQGEWEAVMGSRPSERIGTRAPVNFIDWYEAVAYCNRRSRQEGLAPCYSGGGDNIVCNFDAGGYRLPTEAEWEFASRGGIETRNFKYSGSNHAGEVGLYRDNLLVYFEPVGQRKPNELGIYDMSGNMAEWCWDWYDFDYYRVSAAANPRGPLSGIRRVVRGGGWAFSREYLCTGSRFYEVPFRKTSRISFRVVRSTK